MLQISFHQKGNKWKSIISQCSEANLAHPSNAATACICWVSIVIEVSLETQNVANLGQVRSLMRQAHQTNCACATTAAMLLFLQFLNVRESVFSV